MARRLLMNLALLGVLAALGALVWRELTPAPVHDRLGRREAAPIERIVIEQADGSMLRLVRDLRRWRLLEPRRLPASEFHVDTVLRLLETRSERRYPAAEMDLAALGLSEARLRVSLDDQVFVFGGLEPLSQRRYVLAGDEVHLIMDTVSALLRGPWWNFIDRALLGTGEEVVAVETGGELLVGEPAQALIHRWRATEASIVKPMEAADLQRGRPLEMRLANGERIRWRLIEGEQPRLLRADLQLTYYVDGQTLASLAGQEEGN